MSRPKVHHEPRITTAFRLSPDLHARLLAAAADRDVSANWLANRAIAYYLDRLDEQERMLP